MAETTTITTPTGLVIEFTDYPRGYTINGEPAVSVTTVLRILDKPALAWWNMKVGIEGFCELSKRYGWTEDGYPEFTSDDIIGWLKREKLTPYYVSRAAADRGKYVHQALEQLAETGQVPDPRTFPPEGRGYVQGLAGWWNEHGQEFQASEVLVASAKYGFAGTFDLLCTLKDGRRARVDLKTSRNLYPEHHLQLEAYELAAVESGYRLSDVRVAVRVAADGQWEVQESYATADDFLAVLSCFRVMKRLQAEKVPA